MINENLKNIKSQLKTVNRKVKKSLAAFDADGTLWPCDVGKNFFQYQVRNNLLKISDPQREFDRVLKKEGKKAALLWLAKIQAGFSLKEFKQQVKCFLQETPVKSFLFQKHLINWLITENIQIFVVSSSLKWVLDEAVQKFNIPAENIIGVETKIVRGIITDQLILPAPIHKDKVKAFQNKSKETSPLFVAGNTLADQALLELASEARLVVATACPGERNYDSERKLLEIAKSRNWFYQDGMPKLV